MRVYPNDACSAWIAPRGMSWAAINGAIVRRVLRAGVGNNEFVRETSWIPEVISDVFSLSSLMGRSASSRRDIRAKVLRHNGYTSSTKSMRYAPSSPFGLQRNSRCRQPSLEQCNGNQHNTCRSNSTFGWGMQRLENEIVTAGKVKPRYHHGRRYLARCPETEVMPS